MLKNLVKNSFLYNIVLFWRELQDFYKRRYPKAHQARMEYELEKLFILMELTSTKP